jgi:aryl-alcohol dehydrogenase-like predicted oxidoreductase
MEYTRLGNSGLKVSRIALGCMSFGDPDRGSASGRCARSTLGRSLPRPWSFGITFWDTANVYNYGSSEEIVGRAIKTYSRREDVVLATKLHFKMHDGPGGRACPARR